jgi:hypothetical protein
MARNTSDEKARKAAEAIDALLTHPNNEHLLEAAYNAGKGAIESGATSDQVYNYRTVNRRS